MVAGESTPSGSQASQLSRCGSGTSRVLIATGNQFNTARPFAALTTLSRGSRSAGETVSFAPGTRDGDERAAPPSTP